jgi:hypothetical protein
MRWVVCGDCTVISLVGVTDIADAGRLAWGWAIPMAGIAPSASAPAANHFTNCFTIIGNSFAWVRAWRICREAAHLRILARTTPHGTVRYIGPTGGDDLSKIGGRNVVR